MVVTPSYLCFDCIILRRKRKEKKKKEKMEKNYEDINTIVSFSVVRCFRSKGYLLFIIAHERMYLLSISTKEGGTQKKTSCCVHIPSHSFQFCHSCHQ